MRSSVLQSVIRSSVVATTAKSPQRMHDLLHLPAPESSMESVGQMIQNLFHSENAKVNASLVALWYLDLDEDVKKRENIQAVGGAPLPLSN
jgi:hypothetical protein